MSFTDEYFYEQPVDLIHAFSTKEKTADFLRWFLEESIKISQDMYDNKIKKCSPILFSEHANVYQIDYQYFIFMLAKFMAIKCNDDGKIASIVKHFAILKRIKGDKYDITRDKHRKFLMYFFVETLGFLSNRNKYEDQQSTSSAIDARKYIVFVPRIVSFNGVYYNIKSVRLDSIQLNYFIENGIDMLDNKPHLFKNYEVEQIAYGYQKCKLFTQENTTRVESYFSIRASDFYHKRDIVGLNFYETEKYI